MSPTSWVRGRGGGALQKNHQTHGKADGWKKRRLTPASESRKWRIISLTARPHSGIDTRKAINQRKSLFPGKLNSPLGQQLLGLELIWSFVLETLICASGLESNLLWKAITQAQEEVWNPLSVSLKPFSKSADLCQVS